MLDRLWKGGIVDGYSATRQSPAATERLIDEKLKSAQTLRASAAENPMNREVLLALAEKEELEARALESGETNMLRAVGVIR